MINKKLLLKDVAEFHAWLTSLLYQIGDVKNMPFSSLKEFESFFGIQMITEAGEPLITPETSHLKRYTGGNGPITYRMRWISDKVPSSYPCVVVPWFERMNGMDVCSVHYVHLTDFVTG